MKPKRHIKQRKGCMTHTECDRILESSDPQDRPLKEWLLKKLHLDNLNTISREEYDKERNSIPVPMVETKEKTRV